MIIIENVDMWTQEGGVYIVTTNGEIRRATALNAPGNYYLTMGKGAALQARQYHHNIQYQAAEKIMQYGIKHGDFWYYGFLMVKPNLGVFQVKSSPHKKAYLEMIDSSTGDLYEHAQANPSIAFRLNYPGIGAGGLAERDVYPLIKGLPDNVLIYKMDGVK